MFLLSLGIVFFYSIISSSLGLGGGVVFTPLFLWQGYSYHSSATMSQLLILSISLGAFYHYSPFIDYKLVAILEPLTMAGAFAGGWASSFLSENFCKLLFAILLILSVFSLEYRNKLPTTHSTSKEHFRILFPVVFLAGMLSGILGIGGASIIIPAMILLGDIPLKITIASSSLMVGITALLGFWGHYICGHFTRGFSWWFMVAGFSGAFLGSFFSVKISYIYLKKALEVVLILIALWVLISK